MLQVIGTKKCKETMKALRFFKERRIDVQFVDLRQRALSAGELESIAGKIGSEDMIDHDSKHYRERGLNYMVYDPLEELEAHPELLKTPIIRTRSRVVAGYDPTALEECIGDAGA